MLGRHAAPEKPAQQGNSLLRCPGRLGAGAHTVAQQYEKARPRTGKGGAPVPVKGAFPPGPGGGLHVKPQLPRKPVPPQSVRQRPQGVPQKGVLPRQCPSVVLQPPPVRLHLPQLIPPPAQLRQQPPGSSAGQGEGIPEQGPGDLLPFLAALPAGAGSAGVFPDVFGYCLRVRFRRGQLQQGTLQGSQRPGQLLQPDLCRPGARVMSQRLPVRRDQRPQRRTCRNRNQHHPFSPSGKPQHPQTPQNRRQCPAFRIPEGQQPEEGRCRHGPRHGGLRDSGKLQPQPRHHHGGQTPRRRQRPGGKKRRVEIPGRRDAAEGQQRQPPQQSAAQDASAGTGPDEEPHAAEGQSGIPEDRFQIPGTCPQNKAQSPHKNPGSHRQQACPGIPVVKIVCRPTEGGGAQTPAQPHQSLRPPEQPVPGSRSHRCRQVQPSGQTRDQSQRRRLHLLPDCPGGQKQRPQHRSQNFQSQPNSGQPNQPVQPPPLHPQHRFHRNHPFARPFFCKSFAEGTIRAQSGIKV